MRKNERPRLLEAAVVAVIVILFSSPIWGQEPLMRCLPGDEMAQQLEDLFDEMPIARAVTDDGNLVHFYTSDETGTWTAARTAPGGPACVIAVGDGWESIPPSPKGTPMAWHGQWQER